VAAGVKKPSLMDCEDQTSSGCEAVETKVDRMIVRLLSCTLAVVSFGCVVTFLVRNLSLSQYLIYTAIPDEMLDLAFPEVQTGNQRSEPCQIVAGVKLKLR
jgi:hypothetical protein